MKLCGNPCPERAITGAPRIISGAPRGGAVGVVVLRRRRRRPQSLEAEREEQTKPDAERD